MATLRKARNIVRVLVIALLLVDIAAVVVLVSPKLGAGQGRTQELTELRGQVRARSRIVVPPEQIQSRIEAARQQIKEFHEKRLPAQSSALFDQLGKLASQHSVRLEQARYNTEEAELPGLRRVAIDATLSGDYLNEVKFINALERAPMFFIVDSVRLNEQQAGSVTLGLRLETYLKGGAQ